METQLQTDHKTQRQPEYLTYYNVHRGPNSCDVRYQVYLKLKLSDKAYTKVITYQQLQRYSTQFNLKDQT